MTAPAPYRPWRATCAERRPLTDLLAPALALIALAAATQASAEVGLSTSLASDFRYRGYSLTAEKPALTATLNLDHASGAYASLSAIGAFTRHDGPRIAGYQAYLGYARRLDANASVEVGLSSTEVTQFYQTRYRVKYAEVFAGLSGKAFSGHIYYSPDYLGEKVETLYGSLDWSRATGDAWRYFAHAGVLAPLHPKPTDEIRRSQYDISVGAARRVGDFEFQLNLSKFGPDTNLVAGQPQTGAAATLGVTVFF